MPAWSCRANRQTPADRMPLIPSRRGAVAKISPARQACRHFSIASRLTPSREADDGDRCAAARSATNDGLAARTARTRRARDACACGPPRTPGSLHSRRCDPPLLHCCESHPSGLPPGEAEPSQPRTDDPMDLLRPALSTASSSAAAPPRSPATTATSSSSRSPRSRAGSAARRRPSRPTSTTRPARRHARSRPATAATAAPAAPTPARATARATPTCTAGAAGPARRHGSGRASVCARRCAAGPSSTGARRRRMTGHARTRAGAARRRCGGSSAATGRRRRPSAGCTGRGDPHSSRPSRTNARVDVVRGREGLRSWRMRALRQSRPQCIRFHPPIGARPQRGLGVARTRA